MESNSINENKNTDKISTLEQKITELKTQNNQLRKINQVKNLFFTFSFLVFSILLILISSKSNELNEQFENFVNFYHQQIANHERLLRDFRQLEKKYQILMNRIVNPDFAVDENRTIHGI